MRQLNEIIVHCTATSEGWMAGSSIDAKIAEVRRWHMAKNWTDVGYHFLIDRDGSVGEGRPLDKVGAHVKGHNVGSIGVALVGGRGGAADDAFNQNFTEAQDRALRKLIAQLRAEYPGITKVSGHNDYTNAKTCPTFRVGPWLAQQPHKPKKERVSMAQSTTLQASAVTKVAAAATPLVGSIGGLDWKQMLILAGLAVIILIGTGIIDFERIKKWKMGDR